MNRQSLQKGEFSLQRSICVVGSLNVDLTANAPRFPRPGETILGSRFAVFTGGKGGNQAVAAARLGARVSMIGCVGADANGELYQSVLAKEGVDAKGVSVLPGATTGVTLIEVDETGENTIVLVCGANDELTCDMITERADAIREARVLLLQLETPMVCVNHAAALARQAGCLVVLDPAPAQPVPDAVLALCDYVTPNETELSVLTGKCVDTIDEAIEAAGALLQRGARAVINKRGAQGALLVTRAGAQLFPGYKVATVDTTAAGDTFNAALAVGLTLDYEIGDAIRLANAAAAISTTGLGAQAAMPSMMQAMGIA